MILLYQLALLYPFFGFSVCFGLSFSSSLKLHSTFLFSRSQQITKMAQCDKHHGLKRWTETQLIAENAGYKNGYVCDKCGAEYVGTSYHCSLCEYDLCFDCFRENEVFCTTKSHLLSNEHRLRFVKICKSLQS